MNGPILTRGELVLLYYGKRPVTVEEVAEKIAIAQAERIAEWLEVQGTGDDGSYGDDCRHLAVKLRAAIAAQKEA